MAGVAGVPSARTLALDVDSRALCRAFVHVSFSVGAANWQENRRAVAAIIASTASEVEVGQSGKKDAKDECL